MDLSKIGSLSSYMKTMKLETKWKQKKSSGDFQSESKKTELQRKNEQFKAQYYKQQEENPEDETLKTINNKIAAGTKLSPTEMRYLQTKNPMLYQKLKNDEQQEKAFEKELKNCKTKDEVERLKLSSVSRAMSSISAVKNNPNIPEGTKLAIAESEMRKLQKLNKIVAKFVKSGEYAKLPTDAEVQKAQKDMAEAKQAQTEEILNVENISADKKSVETKTAETAGNNNEIPKAEDITEADKEKTVQPDDKKPTIAEAEHSPQAEKIKRSKAKKAYLDAENNFITEGIPVTENFNNTVKNIR